MSDQEAIRAAEIMSFTDSAFERAEQLLVERDAARGIATQLEQENARLRAVVEAVAKTCGDVIAVEDFGQSRAIPPTRRLLAINLRAAAARGVL